MPKFQRRHYEAVAELLAGEKPVKMPYQTEDSFLSRASGWASIVFQFERMFEGDNPNFQTDRFRTAVGL